MMKLFMLILMLFFNCNMYLKLTVMVTLSFLLMSTMWFHTMSYFIFNSSMVWDTLSMTLVSLSIWITLLMIMSSSKIMNYSKYKPVFLVSIMSLLLILMATFSMSSYIMFYILFEASLIPTFMLILGWGYQPERIQAGMYMLLYTVTSSLPLLIMLIVLSLKYSSMNMLLMELFSFKEMTSFLFMLIVTTAFLVKLPMYAVHLWLPKAHVEAPVAGSMILAGILLKLGGYGLIRLSTKLLKEISTYSWVVSSWALVGGSMISIICLRQVDMKSLIALSSVAHMTMVIAGTMTLKVWGMNGAAFIMVGHGFCSSALFAIANMAYERTNSRSMLFTKGMQTLAPTMTLWWFILCAANMAVPPSLSLMGELNSTVSLVSWNMTSLVPISMLVFFSACYSLYLFVMTQHGKSSTTLLNFKPFNKNEYLILMLHTLPMFMLISCTSMFQTYIYLSNLTLK